MKQTPAEAAIRSEIARRGPVTFARYMQIVLHDPVFGYYARRVPGPGGDFETSPTVSPVFGACMAEAVERFWDELGRPDRLDVCEVGPGSADLVSAAMDNAPEGLRRAWSWVLVEPNPEVEQVQRARLDGRPVRWVRDLRQASPVNGCILANELLDTLPVHLVTRRKGELRELYVAAGDSLRLEPGPLSSPRLSGVEVGEGDTAEAGLAALDWVTQAAAVLEHGYLLLVDYTSVNRSTLRTYRRDDLGTDPLAEPGVRDITTHVDFDAVIREGEGAGLRVVTRCSQKDFLLATGLRERLEEMTSPDPQTLNARSAAALLAARGGLGDFEVLVMSRSAPDVPALRPAQRPAVPVPPRLGPGGSVPA
ncbi:MAG TPA: SAM-dependent methyltransferase [Actinomycetota bacterium]|nr:SAM-dependent methyltransferase [Actinomycetota bacterium]